MRKVGLILVLAGVVIWGWPSDAKAQCEGDINGLCTGCNDLGVQCPVTADETSNCGCDWFDDFESYAVGVLGGPPNAMDDPVVINQWQGWGQANNVRGNITTAQAFSGTKSLEIPVAGTDQVHRMLGFGISGDNIGYDADVSGFWVLEAQTYFPTGHSGTSFIILNSNYNTSATNVEWHLDMRFDSSVGAGEVSADEVAGPTLPMIKDQWVEVKVSMNWGTDQILVQYGGATLVAYAWSADTGHGPEHLFLGNIDLFNDDGTGWFVDDISMTAATPPALATPDMECQTVSVSPDPNRCSNHLVRMRNNNLTGNISTFYLDLEAGSGGRKTACRGANGSIVAITPPAGWTVNNCTSWNGGHVLFRFVAQTVGDELEPGQALEFNVTVDANEGQENTAGSGAVVPAFSVLMSVAQLAGNEVSAVCAGGNFTFGPQNNGDWSTADTCTAFLNAPASSLAAKVILAILLIGGGAVLVIRSRRTVLA